MTQNLRQSIQLLQLNNLELSQKIEQETMENPMLEIVDVKGNIETQFEKSFPAEGNNSQLRNQKRDLAWENSFNNNQNYLVKGNYGNEKGFITGRKEDSDRFQNFLEGSISNRESFQEKVFKEISLIFDKSSQIELAGIIVSSLDKNGFLTQDVYSLASSMGYNDKEEVDFVLSKIQESEPVGLATANIQESLLVQAKVNFPENDLIRLILKDYFKELGSTQKAEMAKKLNTDPEKIHSALDLISVLKPYPASQLDDEKTEYIVPDISILLNNGDIEIQINDTWMPKLSIQKDYRKLLDDRKDDKLLKKEDRDYISKKLSDALWLIRGVDIRRKTLYRVIEAIVKYQKDFFFHGPKMLKPLSLQEIAQSLDLHKSTISRISSGKYVETSWGTFELKYFFARSLQKGNGEAILSMDLQNRIRDIVDGETDVLTDEMVSQLLKSDGIDIARRTVAKYRESMGILSSNQRKRKKINKILLSFKTGRKC